MSRIPRGAKRWRYNWRLRFVAVLLLIGLAGCGSEQSDLAQSNSVPVSLNITLPEKVAVASNLRSTFWATLQRWLFPTEAWAAGNVTDLSILRVEVSATDLRSPISKEVEVVNPSSGQVITIPLAVPVGSGRVFTVSGLDATRARIFLVERDAVTLNAGQTTTVNVELKELGPPGSLTDARSLHTATLLPNGKVLAVGGNGANAPLASAELYDPTTKQWTKLATGLTDPRTGHTAMLLRNGQVLAVGGFGGSFGGQLFALASAESYDPTTNQWTKLATGLTDARGGHTGTLLPNGKVLVVGGAGGNGPLASAELYDPTTNQWTKLATGLTDARTGHTATLLRKGQVLVVGGFSGSLDSQSFFLASAELYDPTTNQWTKLATGLTDARGGHTATLLPNGQVLVVGGAGANGPLASAELYDSTTNQWTKLATSLTDARTGHTTTLLPNGQVLVVSGLAKDKSHLVSAELYDPTTNQWTKLATSLTDARTGHADILLPNGQVLVVGGIGNDGQLASVELLDLSLL